MRTLFQAASLAGLLFFGWTAPAQAVVVVPVNGGWVEFLFEGTGDPLPAFQIDALTPVQFTIVDGYLSGDRFTLNGLGSTSAPLSTGDDIGDDFDAALADGRWSSGVFLLPPGNHTLTGTVAVSPFGFGAGGVRAASAPVDTSQPSVPEAGTGLLLGIGLAGIAAQRRLRSRSQT